MSHRYDRTAPRAASRRLWLGGLLGLVILLAPPAHATLRVQVDGLDRVVDGLAEHEPALAEWLTVGAAWLALFGVELAAADLPDGLLSVLPTRVALQLSTCRWRAVVDGGEGELPPLGLTAEWGTAALLDEALAMFAFDPGRGADSWTWRPLDGVGDAPAIPGRVRRDGARLTVRLGAVEPPALLAGGAPGLRAVWTGEHGSDDTHRLTLRVDPEGIDWRYDAPAPAGDADPSGLARWWPASATSAWIDGRTPFAARFAEDLGALGLLGAFDTVGQGYLVVTGATIDVPMPTNDPSLRAGLPPIAAPTIALVLPSADPRGSLDALSAALGGRPVADGDEPALAMPTTRLFAEPEAFVESAALLFLGALQVAGEFEVHAFAGEDAVVVSTSPHLSRALLKARAGEGRAAGLPAGIEAGQMAGDDGWPAAVGALADNVYRLVRQVLPTRGLDAVHSTYAITRLMGLVETLRSARRRVGGRLVEVGRVELADRAPRPLPVAVAQAPGWAERLDAVCRGAEKGPAAALGIDLPALPDGGPLFVPTLITIMQADASGYGPLAGPRHPWPESPDAPLRGPAGVSLRGPADATLVEHYAGRRYDAPIVLFDAGLAPRHAARALRAAAEAGHGLVVVLGRQGAGEPVVVGPAHRQLGMKRYDNDEVMIVDRPVVGGSRHCIPAGDLLQQMVAGEAPCDAAPGLAFELAGCRAPTADLAVLALAGRAVDPARGVRAQQWVLDPDAPARWTAAPTWQAALTRLGTARRIPVGRAAP